MAETRPRILTMLWGEHDAVLVEIEGATPAVLLPGDSFSWTVDHRKLMFTISVEAVDAG